MFNIYRRRRFGLVFLLCFILFGFGIYSQLLQEQQVVSQNERAQVSSENSTPATEALEALAVKGRAPKTNYSRTMFGSGWRQEGSCDTRNNILARDLENTTIENCKVYSGVLNDPYTKKKIYFTRGPETSDDIQIDHVVALSDAWQKGAQQLDQTTREALANDPLELLAVEGQANQDKSGSDAASWLPPNKSYRCRYVARQIAVKQKYSLWVTMAEKQAMERVLSECPEQVLPITQP